MSKVSRRAALGAIGVGAVAVAAYRMKGEAESLSFERPAPRTGDNAVVRENLVRGSDEWILGRGDTARTDDELAQLQGYASKTSVSPGESLDFHLSSHLAQGCTVAIYRIGHYGGVGARHLLTRDAIRVGPRTGPSADAEGLIACDWPVSWTLDVPSDWVSGIFLAVFTSDDGFRSYTPFVVRDTTRGSDILMVVPFTTYQAYNIWPLDGRTGKNLYKGYVSEGKVGGGAERAFRVSFDRPYAQGGIPRWFEMETSAARWFESAGHDITYASGVDLHEGRIDPSEYTAIVFSGHDEYWSKEMRDCAEEAVSVGTHLAFLASNNIYFHIRLEEGADGASGRVVTCYKDAPDPDPGAAGPTVRWRQLGKKHGKAEQKLLGVQYNGILAEPAPLVVRKSGHWFWAGTGLRDGDEIRDLVAVEADGFDPSMPQPEDTQQTLLSASPYADSMGRGRRTQNTSLCEDERGTLVFVGGTFHWPLALSEPDHLDEHVRRATGNLLKRMLEPRV